MASLGYALPGTVLAVGILGPLAAMDNTIDGWMRSAFGLLAKLKGLRGGPLDIFGKAEERRTERALIGEYRSTIDELLRGMNATNLDAALEIARLPEDIRGYGHVKARHLAAVKPKWERLLAQWRAGGARAVA